MCLDQTSESSILSKIAVTVDQWNPLTHPHFIHPENQRFSDVFREYVNIVRKWVKQSHELVRYFPFMLTSA